ncbi:MAG: chemotaxis protein [Shewanella sp.]|nr:chemotaxis protein [Shewanella sp.]MCF1429637.1 chemotaxis protein [Shewanella sp.]MCF1438992.1 chemotaxis protein [Shewanella sp.]MCF1457406.1 chemotaxis protein [Shewanella sp.]
MQVNSAMSSALAGIQSAQSGITQATIDVARSDPNNQAVEAGKEPQLAEQDKTQALATAKAAENQGEASAKVVEEVSETIGSLIDIKV